MLTIRGGNTLGCLPSADDRLLPVSTSLRTSPAMRASSLFSVCSVRIVSARSSDRPELIIVANWRLKTARSFSLTFLPMPGIFSSVFIPARCGWMLTGAYPIDFSRWTTCACVSPSRVPVTSFPALSRTEYSNVVVDAMTQSLSGPATEPVEVLDVVALLEAGVVGDAAAFHQLGQVLVHRVHAVLGAGLQ